MRFSAAWIALFILLGWAGAARADACHDAVLEAKRTGDWTGAATVCGQAAERGSAQAQHSLGILYFEGHGVPQDAVAARTWIARAAEQGLAESQTWLGYYYRYRDPGTALDLFRRAAGQGHAVAQARLADMYAMGQGVARDYTEAAKWYQLAAAQGDIDAQDSLGAMHMRGLGVPQDYAEAANWFHKVAERRPGARQSTLCELYMDGKGVAQDDVQAHMWCSLAAQEYNDRKLRERRDALGNRMSPTQIAEAEALARAWMERHKAFDPDPIVACDLGQRGVMHTRRAICAREGGRPESGGQTGTPN